MDWVCPHCGHKIGEYEQLPPNAAAVCFPSIRIIDTSGAAPSREIWLPDNTGAAKP